MSASSASIVQSLVEVFKSKEVSGHLRVDLGPFDECTYARRSPGTDIAASGVPPLPLLLGQC